MSSFTFRQRVGKLDWKAVSSIDTDEVVIKSNIKELQHVVDAVTFCDFAVEDVKNSTVDSIRKLISVQQLITEYLLFCQEAQFKAMREVQKKQDKLKQHNDKLRKENVSLKEDRKIYQRQLAMLRKSLPAIPGMPYANNPDIPPRVFSLMDTDLARESKAGSGIVDTLLKHELDTRDFMADLLDDQRKTFAEQMRVIVEAVAGTKPSTQNGESGLPAQIQIEQAVTAAMKSIQENIAQTLADLRKSASSQQEQKPPPLSRQPSKQLRSRQDSKDGDRDIAELLRQAALEEMEEELQAREQELKTQKLQLEADQRRLRAKEVDLQMQISSNEIKAALSAQQQQEQEPPCKKRSIGGPGGEGAAQEKSALVARLNASNAILRIGGHKVAGKAIKNIIWNALLSRARRAWQHWWRVAREARETDRAEEEAHLLHCARVQAREQALAQAGQAGSRQSELEKDLDGARERCEEMEDKLRGTQQSLRKAEARVRELETALHAAKDEAATTAAIAAAAKEEQTQRIPLSREQELLGQLQRAREDAVIHSAKFNALRMKSDKQIADLLEQLKGLQPASKHISAMVSSDAGVMTSMEFPTYSSAPVPAPSSLRRSIQMHSLVVGSGADEEDLMAQMERRVALRSGCEDPILAEHMEQQAMAALAQELNARLTGDTTEHFSHHSGSGGGSPLRI